MRIRHLASVALAASLAGTQAFAAAPSGAVANPHKPKPNLSQSTGQANSSPSRAAGGSAMVNVRGCNHSGSNILVAMMYQKPNDNSGDWKSEGWYKIANGECRALFDTTTANFYLHAENDGGDREWGDEGFWQCVAYPGPYDDLIPSGSKECPEDGMTSVKFVSVTASKFGTFEYTFDQ